MPGNKFKIQKSKVKIISFFVAFLTVSFYFLSYIPETVYALVSCPNPKVQTIPKDETTPRELKNNDGGAEFTIEVNRKKEEEGGLITDWIMEWECGGSNRRVATGVGDTNIKASLSNVGGSCAFLPHNSHVVKVKQIVTGGSEVDFCQATYKVIDSNSLCELSLADDSNGKITTTTKLGLGGENLTPGGRFVVFVDDIPLGVNAANVSTPCLIISVCVDAPKFSNYSIPTQYMSPGSHIISLRTKTNQMTGFSGNLKDYFGPPLCSIPYTVGDASSPGSIGTPTNTAAAPTSTGVDCKNEPEKCSSAGGESCTDGLTGPQIAAGVTGIKTAIGCVPTEPRALVEGVLKVTTFGIGAVALLIMFFGALKMITADGNPEAIQAGKDQFTAAILGLLFIIFSVLLLQVIGVDILGLPGFGR